MRQLQQGSLMLKRNFLYSRDIMIIIIDDEESVLLILDEK